VISFVQNNGITPWNKCNFELSDARDASNPLIKKPNVTHGACGLVGESIKIDTFVAEDGACKKWRVEYNYVNWCTDERRGPFVHFYEFRDEMAPIITCNNQMVEANPSTQNPNGVCNGTVVLAASAKDSLLCADESWVKWQVFMDGWNDGTIDRLGSSFVNKAWFGIWVATPRLVNGALNPAWEALRLQHPGVVLADLVYVTYVRPSAASGGGVSLPGFTMDAENISHKVTWKVTDGCGNTDNCESTVMVVDKKAPTPYCLSISTALMQGTPAMVELWAKDFNQNSFDNCTPQSLLYFTFDGVAPIFSRINQEHFYKAGPNNTTVNATLAEYNQGRAFRWIPNDRSAGKVFTNEGVQNVDISVWDEMWNTDFCTVELSIRKGSFRTLTGTITTFEDLPVRNVLVSADMDLPEYPRTDITDDSGVYSISVQDSLPYILNAYKNEDFLNGVSTLDLVFIQRHILDVQPFQNNYQWVAADVNNDGRVTASDMTDLRKLILGIDSQFKNNQSWRFTVKGSSIFTNPKIVFEEESEDITDFNAIKIGDINNSAIFDVIGNKVESRTSKDLVLSVDDLEVKRNQTIEIPVYAHNFDGLMGFQYTMNFRNATFDKIVAGVIPINDENIGNISNNVVTMSYAALEPLRIMNDDILFTIVLKSQEDATVLNMVSLSSDITKSESYNSDFKVSDVRLEARGSDLGKIVLFQNEPNPFKSFTRVSFEMPEEAKATIRVSDMTGKVVLEREIEAQRGLNTEEFTRNDLGGSGIYLYTLTSGDFSETKKMIIVE